jgi:hypothetical protein
MRISIGIDNNAGDMDVAATDLGSDTAPKIFRRDNLNGSAVPRRGLRGSATSGQEQDDQQKDSRQDTRESEQTRWKHRILLLKESRTNIQNKPLAVHTTM